MTKRSGFAVKITAFIEADPKDMTEMGSVVEQVADLNAMLKSVGFIQIQVDSRFMLSREVPVAPDEPKAAEAQGAVQIGPIFTPPAGVENVTVIVESDGFDGPEFLDASKRSKS